MIRKRPKSDFAKPTAPTHDFPAAWYSEPVCTRCRKTLSAVEASGAPCVSDEAIRAGQVFARVTK